MELQVQVDPALKGPIRVRDDKTFRAFAILYHDLKDTGLIPKEITAKIQELLEIGPTTYYDYLRVSRNKGYISDSFKETREAFLARIRKTLDVAESVAVYQGQEIEPEVEVEISDEVPVACECLNEIEASQQRKSSTKKKGIIARLFGL